MSGHFKITLVDDSIMKGKSDHWKLEFDRTDGKKAKITVKVPKKLIFHDPDLPNELGQAKAQTLADKILAVLREVLEQP